nr:hypothetical protein [uncultured Sphingomonas sp.]
MAIENICDECGGFVSHQEFDETALHDLAVAIAKRDPEEAFMALDMLIRDFASADAMRERIAIARASR